MAALGGSGGAEPAGSRRIQARRLISPMLRGRTATSPPGSRLPGQRPADAFLADYVAAPVETEKEHMPADRYPRCCGRGSRAWIWPPLESTP